MATDRIRLVASDMDATLLDEHSCLPQGFAGMVHALAQKDIRFAAASGRPLYTLEEMFAGLLDTVILIGDNGGAIRWQRQRPVCFRDACRRLAAAGKADPGKPGHRDALRAGLRICGKALAVL